MKIVISIVCLTCTLLLLPACNAQDKEVVNDPATYAYYSDWDIDMEYLEAGCRGGYDCIRSLDEPVFISVDEVDFIQDNDLVIGLKLDGEVRAYPHAILDWHEIVNDRIGNTWFSINYCPLTGSGMAWDRRLDDKLTQFGVSGLLYNSNVIPYDRATGSHWSQMRQECVNGEYYRQKVKSYPVIETTWSSWKRMYPDSKVVSTNTGMTRDYGNYPYYSYKDDEDVYFPTSHEIDTIHPKERYYGIINDDAAHLFAYSLFFKGIGMVADTIWDTPVLAVGSMPDQVMLVVDQADGKKLDVLYGQLPLILKDENGNRYDVFGYCVEGPDKGTRLTLMNGFTAYWFAWATFYPELSLYKP